MTVEQHKRPCIQVTVTGAAGQIAYALLFRIASGAVFGENTDLILRCLELPQAMPALKAVAMELMDCAFPRLKDLICTDDVDLAMKDTHWAFLIGSAPRKQGMERSDLLKINAPIFEAQARALNKHAARGVRILVVGNPCNTNAWIVAQYTPSIPKEHIYAMTMLDELRARSIIAKKAGVSVDAITRLAIWGNHSATQYPNIDEIRIAGKPVREVIRDHEWLDNEFIPSVQQRGAEVIKARGSSSAASAAHAIIQTIHHLTHPTRPGDYFSLVVCSGGEYFESGIMMSLPVRVNESGNLQVVRDIHLSHEARSKIIDSLEELRREKEAVRFI